jgi:alkylation response protein AidB-like acyl-CoA dehydrogenase
VVDVIQDPPVAGDPYRTDAALRAALERVLPREVWRDVAPGLERLGARVVHELEPLAAAAEREPPRHVPFDPWGRRVDRIEVSSAWRALHAIAAEEGIVASAYERRHGAWSRLEQCARLYLYHPASAVASCPMAMTDGAARVLIAQGDADARSRVVPHLLTREPDAFWTSGQWMTERSGGSDVSGTSTIARREAGGFRLYGVKWFSSATTAEIALALARIEGAPEGSRGLTLFLVELRDGEGELRGIRVERLKDKLGTRALPTAELTLDGAPARQVGEEGRGVATVATMLNVTRYYNAACAAASMARGLALATDYAARRVAFGKRLLDHPLHRETLAELAAEHQLALQLVLRTAQLLGREETGEADPAERALLRLLTPLVKLLTGKQAVASASEVLECFGGAGYVEDTGLPRLLRDAQVLAIWEGTTNILALDAERAIAREGGLEALVEDARRRCAELEAPWAEGAATALRAIEQLRDGLAAQSGPEARERGARRLAMGLGRAYGAVLLCEQAAWEASGRVDAGAADAARRAVDGAS